MEIKTTKPTNAFGFTMKTTLEKLVETVGNKPGELMQKVKELELVLTGPQIWLYNGCDGQIDKEFDLTVTIPIVEPKEQPTDDFEYISLPAYKCASAIHNGAYSEFGAAYTTLMDEISKAGHVIDGSNREVYIHCDFEDQSNCVTELQVGIK